MPLSTVRDIFKEMCGRGDWTASNTTSMDRFINQGQQMLDNMIETPHSNRRLITTIFPSDCAIVVPSVRSIMEVWVYASDGRYKLTKAELPALLETYNDFEPPYLDSDVVDNGRFAGSADGWTANTGWTYGNNAVTHSSGTGTLEQDITVVIGAYRVVVVVSGRTAGTVTPSINAVDGTAIAADGISCQSIAVASAGSVTLALTPSTDFDGTVDGVIVQRIVDAGSTGDSGTGRPIYYAPDITTLSPGMVSYDISDLVQKDDWQSVQISSPYSKRGIVVYPPADVQYTVNIYATFFSETLSRSADTSYWTEVYPNILALAATYQYESYFRNNSGMTAIYGNLVTQLRGIDNMVVMEEMQEVNQMEG